MQALGVDGGIYDPIEETFEPQIDAAFTRHRSAKTIEEAHEINLQGIASIDEDPEEYNAYVITAVGILG